MWSVFKCLRILVFTLKTDRFQNAPFSNLCVFISVFEMLRFHSGAMWMQGQKGEVLLRFHMKTEQCERGLRMAALNVFMYKLRFHIRYLHSSLWQDTFVATWSSQSTSCLSSFAGWQFQVPRFSAYVVRPVLATCIFIINTTEIALAYFRSKLVPLW